MSTDHYSPGMIVMGTSEFDDLLFVTKCFLEIKNRNKVSVLADEILSHLKTIAYTQSRLTYSSRHGFVGLLAIRIIAQEWKEHSETLLWLKSFILSNADSGLRAAAVRELTKTWKDDPEILFILKKCTHLSTEPLLQQTALIELARGWKQEPDTLLLLQKYIKSDDCKYSVRSQLVKEIARIWIDELWLFDFLVDRATNDPFVRPHLLNLKEDLELNPRMTALNALLTYYSNHPKTLELLNNRALNDPDEQLREWAQQQLEEMEQS